MKPIVAIAAMLALALSSGAAEAKACKDPKTGKFVKCAAAAAPARCKDPKTGKFAKCSAPGAVPA